MFGEKQSAKESQLDSAVVSPSSWKRSILKLIKGTLLSLGSIVVYRFMRTSNTHTIGEQRTCHGTDASFLPQPIQSDQLVKMDLHLTDSCLFAGSRMMLAVDNPSFISNPVLDLESLEEDGMIYRHQESTQPKNFFNGADLVALSGLQFLLTGNLLPLGFSILYNLPFVAADFDCNKIFIKNERVERQYRCSPEEIVGNQTRITATENTYETQIAPTSDCEELRDDGLSSCSELYPALLACEFDINAALIFLMYSATSGVQRCEDIFEYAMTGTSLAVRRDLQKTAELSQLSEESSRNDTQLDTRTILLEATTANQTEKIQELDDGLKITKDELSVVQQKLAQLEIMHNALVDVVSQLQARLTENEKQTDQATATASTSLVVVILGAILLASTIKGVLKDIKDTMALAFSGGSELKLELKRLNKALKQLDKRCSDYFKFIQGGVGVVSINPLTVSHEGYELAAIRQKLEESKQHVEQWCHSLAKTITNPENRDLHKDEGQKKRYLEKLSQVRQIVGFLDGIVKKLFMIAKAAQRLQLLQLGVKPPLNVRLSRGMKNVVRICCWFIEEPRPYQEGLEVAIEFSKKNIIGYEEEIDALFRKLDTQEKRGGSTAQISTLTSGLQEVPYMKAAVAAVDRSAEDRIAVIAEIRDEKAASEEDIFVSKSETVNARPKSKRFQSVVGQMVKLKQTQQEKEKIERFFQKLSTARKRDFAELSEQFEQLKAAPTANLYKLKSLWSFIQKKNEELGGSETQEDVDVNPLALLWRSPNPLLRTVER